MASAGNGPDATGPAAGALTARAHDTRWILEKSTYIMEVTHSLESTLWTSYNGSVPSYGSFLHVSVRPQLLPSSGGGGCAMLEGLLWAEWGPPTLRCGHIILPEAGRRSLR
eukprot:scaffold990_cov393-Prasinococcus_capsulatus_cf.AAC.22